MVRTRKYRGMIRELVSEMRFYIRTGVPSDYNCITKCFDLIHYNDELTTGLWEREISGERTMAAFDHMRSQDRLCGLKAPFGWEKDPDRPKYVKLCPVEADICRKVYKLRDAGLSYREISDVLEDYGHVNRLGNKFGKESIRKIYISKKRVPND